MMAVLERDNDKSIIYISDYVDREGQEKQQKTDTVSVETNCTFFA